MSSRKYNFPPRPPNKKTTISGGGNFFTSLHSVPMRALKKTQGKYLRAQSRQRLTGGSPSSSPQTQSGGRVKESIIAVVHHFGL